MKVYYIGNKYDGCYYVRCLQPLIQNVWDGERTSLRSKRADAAQMTRGALNADIVVFQRPDDIAKLTVVDLLKKAGKRVVFDNDDTYLPNSGTSTTVDTLWGQNKLQEMHTNLTEFVKKSDLVTTTTEFLAQEYRQNNDKVVVLPNCVDPDDWPFPLKNETNKVRIGLVGSTAVNKDYEQIIPILQELSNRSDVQLVVFAMPPNKEGYTKVREAYRKDLNFWDNLNVEWQPLVNIADYFDTLNNLRLDIMLIPRQETYFNKCKSNVKFLEAAMLEIPVIASSFSDKNSPYDKDLDGENGILVGMQEDWRPHIERLIKDKELRRSMGVKAKEYTLKNYNIHNLAHRWEDAYRTIL